VLVVLDACVLYPPSLRDLLLTLAALDAIDVRWSEEILDELVRNIVADHPDIDPDRFEQHTIAAMREHFPKALVPVDADLVARLDNHPKDRHVAAVAVTADASAIVTLNVKDFESQPLTEAGVEVLTPGAVVDRLVAEVPEVMTYAIREIADRLRSPPMTPEQLISLLARHPSMAEPMARVAEVMANQTDQS